MGTEQQQSRSFLPDFCSVRMLFVVVLLGELLAIILTLTPATGVEDRIANLALYSLFIQWIILSCTAVLCISRNRLNQLSDFWAATLSYLITLIIAFIITELAWWLFHDRPLLNNTTGHGHFLLRCMGISAIVSALSLRYFFVQHQWRKNIESEAESRVQALQSRIRPHFLFNCMNTIASLTRKDPSLAEQATEDLADLFRVSLRESKRVSTLAEEVALCEHYLRIEKHRFGERLNVEWVIENLPDDAHLPTLTLQPIIENAIYHGIEPLPDGGVIRIHGTLEKNILSLSIENPMPEDQQQDKHQGNHMAQDNIRQRLEAYYGKRAELHARSHEHNYQTTISIPYPYEDIDR